MPASADRSPARKPDARKPDARKPDARPEGRGPPGRKGPPDKVHFDRRDPKDKPSSDARGRGKPMRGVAPEDGPRFVGGARNEHGTRVARRVTCTRCGNVDHVAYAPKDSTKALCRTCAMQVLETYESGVKVRMPTRRTTCNLCGVPFDLPVAAEDDGDPLCKNCLLGFTTWQGSVDRTFEERTNTVIEARPSGTVVRKTKKPS